MFNGIPAPEFNAWLEHPVTKQFVEYANTQRVVEREACVQYCVRAEVDKARVSASRESAFRDLFVMLQPRGGETAVEVDPEFVDPNALENA